MKFLRIAFAGVVCAASLFAADLTGTWTGVVKLNNNARPGRGAAAPLPFIVHIKQDVKTVTGRMDGIGGAPDGEIQNGKVAGNTLTYEGIRKINNQDVKFTYTATLSGDTLEFKIVRADGNGRRLSSTSRFLTRSQTVNLATCIAGDC